MLDLVHRRETVSRTRVLERFDIFGAGREDLESRNPETVTTAGATVARYSRFAVKLIHRETIEQAPHEDFGNRIICAKIVLHSRTMNSFCRDSERFLANYGMVVIHQPHSPHLAPADISIT
jgi:hypothetical protein